MLDIIIHLLFTLIWKCYFVHFTRGCYLFSFFFYLFLISSYFNGDQLKIVRHNGILIHYKIDLIRCIHALIFMLFLFHLYNSIHLRLTMLTGNANFLYASNTTLYRRCIANLKMNNFSFHYIYAVNIGMYQEFDCRATMLWWRLVQQLVIITITIDWLKWRSSVHIKANRCLSNRFVGRFQSTTKMWLRPIWGGCQTMNDSPIWL